MISEKKPGFAIVGCGLIGRKRSAALTAGALRFVCDLDLARAQELARATEGCRATNDLAEAIGDPGVQAVIISVANSALATTTLEAVRAGKHVLVEKPGATSSIDLAKIEASANQTKALVRIGFNHRFHPAFLKAYDLVQKEDLGAPMFIRGRYGHGGRIGYDREWRADPKLSGGGELIDQGVHLIDLAASFLGEFTRIDGHVATYYWDMPVDDNAFLSLQTGDGKTAWLHASWTEWKNLFSFEIYFEHAKLHIEGLGGSYGVERLYYYKMLPEMGPPETVIYEFPRGDTSWAIELGEFMEDIRLGRPPVPGLSEARETLQIVEQIYERSARALSSMPEAQGPNL